MGLVGGAPHLEVPRLVVPEGLVIDDVARDRLERALARLPVEVRGVGAATGPLAPGASYRVHAEWCALDEPPLPADIAAAGPRETVGRVRGAVLLRPGVGYSVRDCAVEIAGGGVVVDPGAHVHDPHTPAGPLEVASERGRPPYPRRPVVVFLACERTGRADWARGLANRLVRRDVEARIAVPDAAEGLHLTRPCRPGAETVRALAPDVVVTLDAAAAAVADDWLAPRRSPVVVAFDPDAGAPQEVVSWRIGRASGRLRARIRADVDASAFAGLVNRLCAGPQPVPPRVGAPRAQDPEVRERWTVAAAARPGCVVVTGPGAPGARVEGLVDNLRAAGVPVTTAAAGRGLPSDARTAAVVLLGPGAASAAVDDLVAQRRRAGLPTVADLGAAALAPGAPARLAGAAAALATACGLVVSPVAAVCAAADAAGARSLLLPTLPTRARAAALRAARAPQGAASPVVVGWHVGRAGEPRADAVDLVAPVVARTAADRSGTRIEIVGDATRVPIARRGNPRVRFGTGEDPDPATIARWDVHLWTPALVGGVVAGDPWLFEEASLAGVPTVLPGAARGVVDGYVSPHVLVQPADSADEWARALRHLVGDAARRAARAAEAVRRAEAVDGPAAARAVVSRFVGWARFAPAGRAAPLAPVAGTGP